MGQRWQHPNFVILQDAQTLLRKEECALGMEQSANVAVKGAQSMLRKEECAVGMGQKIR